MMDKVDPLQHYLKNTMEINRQLHVCVQRKQEEISSLKQRNIQLMELVKQAEIYATLQDAVPPQPDPNAAPAFTPHPDSYFLSTKPYDSFQPSWLEFLLNHTPPEEEAELSHRILSELPDAEVKRKLWPGDMESFSGNKKPRVDQEFHHQSKHHSSEQPDSEMVQIFGSLRNYRLLKATHSLTSDPWREGKCVFFKTSIREHSTVRTGVFPHGKTFTSHTADGGCRFLWIPKQT